MENLELRQRVDTKKLFGRKESSLLQGQEIESESYCRNCVA